MTLTIQDIKALLFEGHRLTIPAETMQRVKECHDFLHDFSAGKVIYGINTGFGPMAQWRIDDNRLRELQYNIIRSHATGAGQPLDEATTLAAMTARLGTFLQARSGIHPDVVTLLAEMINRRICPFIPEHGSVGASGDLVQLAHIALAMIGEGSVRYGGQWRNAGEVLAECGLKPMRIHIREGLSVTNGTAVMTGLSAVNQIYAEQLLDHALLASVWMNEIAASYDDFQAEALNAVRRHEGQQHVAKTLRSLSAGSKRLRRREHFLYDNAHNDVTTFSDKVQAYYSLRCIPQIYGPALDTLRQARNIIDEELNSACDNPIVDPDTKNVYHGGNFHGDYISLEADKVKMVVTRIAMTAERQLNYLFHDRINGILPPFLNMGVLGLNYGMQACQFTATSTTAECQTLSMPNYVHSIPNNNDNQDIVSMGTNSALIARRVIDNAYQVMSIHFIALAQATDCLGIASELAPATQAAYHAIRGITPVITADTPFYEDIARVEQWLRKRA